MGRIKNYLIGEIEAGRREYNPLTREYESTEVKPKLVKMYLVLVEGMTVSKFFSESDARECVNKHGDSASLGFTMEVRK